MCIVNVIRYMGIEIIGSRGSPCFGICLAAMCIYETERTILLASIFVKKTSLLILIKSSSANILADNRLMVYERT